MCAAHTPYTPRALVRPVGKTGLNASRVWKRRRRDRGHGLGCDLAERAARATEGQNQALASPMSTRPMVLIPFDRREAISLREAAKIANRSEGTVRGWCAQFDIGRRVGNGPWQVSRVALAMFLDGDADALREYLSGNRCGQTVAGYFGRFNIPLVTQWKEST